MNEEKKCKYCKGDIPQDRFEYCSSLCQTKDENNEISLAYLIATPPPEKLSMCMDNEL